MTRRDIRKGCMGLPLHWQTARKRAVLRSPFIARGCSPARLPAAGPRRRGRDRSGNLKHDQRNLATSPRTEFRTMFKVPAVFLLSLALAGCAAGPQARLASDPAFTPARCAWDGTGQDPNQPQAQTSHRARTAARSDTDKSVATLQPYSTERWQAQDGIEADQ